MLGDEEECENAVIKPMNSPMLIDSAGELSSDNSSCVHSNEEALNHDDNMPMPVTCSSNEDRADEIKKE